MASPAAGCRGAPSFTAWNAARLLNGEERRPSPAWAPPLTNQMIPATGRLTVAVELPKSLAMV